MVKINYAHRWWAIPRGALPSQAATALNLISSGESRPAWGNIVSQDTLLFCTTLPIRDGREHLVENDSFTMAVKEYHRLFDGTQMSRVMYGTTLFFVWAKAPQVKIRAWRPPASNVPRYHQSVYIDGVWRATFNPSAWSREYSLVDALDWGPVKIDPTRNRRVELSQKAEMAPMIQYLLWFDRIPTLESIEAAKKAALAERQEREAAREAEERENKRLWRIQEQAEALLEATEQLLAITPVKGNETLIALALHTVRLAKGEILL